MNNPISLVTSDLAAGEVNDVGVIKQRRRVLANDVEGRADRVVRWRPGRVVHRHPGRRIRPVQWARLRHIHGPLDRPRDCWGGFHRMAHLGGRGSTHCSNAG